MTEMRTFRYIAQIYKQRGSLSKSLLLFSAPAGEIIAWAGIPRKNFDYQHGFQRTLSPNRISEISSYFSEHKENITPNSVVIGINDSNECVDINILSNEGFQNQDMKDVINSSNVELAIITFNCPNYESMALNELTNSAMESIRQRLSPESIKAIHLDIEQAIAEAAKLEDEEAIEEEFGDEENFEGDLIGDGDEIASRSYLADFYAELLGMQQGLISSPDEKKLREILYSLLKPAIIVDGQHRVFGAAHADESIKLSISALTPSDWAENVYQFVVINQKSKPIKPAFLNAIIATSLSEEEIESIQSRLRTSSFDISKATIMVKINSDENSPFYNMIDFGVENAPGFLQFPGMNKLVRDFRNIPNSHAYLVPDGHAWLSDSNVWLPHFYALWQGVKEYFSQADPRLWSKPSEDNPHNLLKIVTLQEVQTFMLNTWADSRTFRFKSIDQTFSASKDFWDEFPSTFFTDEWKKKGLQTSVGRKIISNALSETRRNFDRKNWGHRRLGLFQDN